MNPDDTRKEDAPKVQGEGDYDAARRHRRDVERFVRLNDTEELAREAQPETPAEAVDLEKAEAEGRARSRSTGSDEPHDPRKKKPEPK